MIKILKNFNGLISNRPQTKKIQPRIVLEESYTKGEYVSSKRKINLPKLKFLEKKDEEST
jgi:hypothetical protein